MGRCRVIKYFYKAAIKIFFRYHIEREMRSPPQVVPRNSEFSSPARPACLFGKAWAWDSCVSCCSSYTFLVPLLFPSLFLSELIMDTRAAGHIGKMGSVWKSIRSSNHCASVRMEIERFHQISWAKDFTIMCHFLIRMMITMNISGWQIMWFVLSAGIIMGSLKLFL